jgi:hypothetical protein
MERMIAFIVASASLLVGYALAEVLYRKVIRDAFESRGVDVKSIDSHMRTLRIALPVVVVIFLIAALTA